LQQLDDAFQGKELALKRYKDLLGGAQGVEREQAERRRAIQYNEIKTLFQRLPAVRKDRIPAPILSTSSNSAAARSVPEGKRNRYGETVDKWARYLFGLEDRRVQIARQHILTEAEPLVVLPADRIHEQARFP
jgi:hypothetical protein